MVYIDLELCCDQSCGKKIEILRMYEKDKNFGDPYDFAAIVITEEPCTIEFKGVLKAPTVRQWRAMCKYFASRRYKELKFERKKNGVSSWHRKSLDRYIKELEMPKDLSKDTSYDVIVTLRVLDDEAQEEFYTATLSYNDVPVDVVDIVQKTLTESLTGLSKYLGKKKEDK
jgi:hypothetical protein